MARKSGNKGGDLFIGGSGQLRLIDKSAEQQTIETRKVECLGMTFANDNERREYFSEELRKILADPEFRQIEGFPIGTDDNIIALSDPPYYTACPNPWIADFIRHYGSPYDPNQPYHREPFVADVSEGKNHPIYNAHSYHTKVPHRAIMRYILHYTEPGDVVLDSFCGTGMTGVAAQLCANRREVESLGWRVTDDGTILNEEGIPISRIGARHAVLNDLSSAATFISSNQNIPLNVAAFEQAGIEILKESEERLGYLYEIDRHKIDHTVWSEVLLCANCNEEIPFWVGGVDHATKSVKDYVSCLHCKAETPKRSLERAQRRLFDPNIGKLRQEAKFVPVAVELIGAGPERELTAEEATEAMRHEEQRITSWYPTASIERDIDLWYERDYRSLGLVSIDLFFTRRNLAVIADLWRRTAELPKSRQQNAIRFALTAMVVNLSRMNRWRPDVSFPYNPLSGTLYVPSLSVESNVYIGVRNKIRRLSKIWNETHLVGGSLISTQSSTAIGQIPDCSLDYVFLDPPFGSNIIYSDLSCLHEAWLGLETNTKQEAVVHRRKKTGAQTLDTYRLLLTACMKEAFRCLKPGRWVTVEFSNTKASVWNAIQSALQEAGFVVANVSSLDKQTGSFKAVTTPTAVKQDLVISAYKPNGGLEERFASIGGTADGTDGVWAFVRNHLSNIPVVKVRGNQIEFVAERDPRILFDRLVAFYLGHSTPIPLGSAEFQEQLAARFPERDGMYFLPEQAAEYDKKRAQVASVGQLSIFVEDERSAIAWLHSFLKGRPSIYQDLHPHFMKQLGASWKKSEAQPELKLLLDQNFLCYDGTSDVPNQIHSYLSTQFKELRNLAKNDARLQAKAANRWYVPDPNKAGDLEKLREKALLKEFAEYRTSTQKRLKVFRIEAIHAGFKRAYDDQDYKTIVSFAARLPENVLQEDEKILLYYDVARLRLGED